MDLKQQREWARLESRAHTLLAQGSEESIEHSVFERLVQVLVLPSFATCTCSEVFVLEDDGDNGRVREHFIATRMTWDQRAELNRLAALAPPASEPILVPAKAPLPDDVAMELAAEVRGIQLPLTPSYVQAGLDGTSYVLTLGEGFTRVSIRWHGEAPDNWAAAGTLAQKVMALVDTAV